MGGPLVGSSAEGVSSSSCLCPSTCEKAGFQHSSCARPEDENVEARIACAQDDLVVKEIGLALAEVMQVCDDNDGEGSDLSEDSDENEDSLSLESDSNDDLADVDTELVTLSASLSGNASESSIGKSEDGDSVSKVTPVLVSAMKGSRAKRGIVTNLSVSWAPDVYDPPVTSDSHTVRAHHRSSRKSHYKYKPPKSSSSRSSSGSKKDKKHSHHSSSSKRDKKSSYRSTGGSSRTDTNDPQHFKAYDNSISSRTDTSDPQHRQPYASSINSIENTVPEYHKLSLWLPPDSVKKEEAVSPAPVLKSIEQIKRSASSCKEPPLSMLSRQFVAAKYKGMFSFWGQNQLAS
ncbi:hypothetical protein ACQ4PT_051703 [Festuca glaucescens]